MLINPIATIALQPAVQAAMTGYRDELEGILQEIISIQQIPAPTFAEEKRAAYIKGRFSSLGLLDVHQDQVKNVYARFPGSDPENRAPVVISAHLDTVFLSETDLTNRRDGDLLYGPGIGDNSTGLAGLVILAESLIRHQLRPLADIWFVANAGEEGLGDLCGMRSVADRYGKDAVYLVIEGGLFGQLTHQAVGVRRYRIQINTPGGHSWGGFGTKSAIHELARVIVAIDSLKVPEQPKTTYNVGKIEGGLSINSIASSASLWLDLRSEDTAQLNRLVEKVNGIIRNLNHHYEANGNHVHVTIEPVGNRPAGSIDRRSPVIVWAETALRHVGCEHVRYIISSTDANIPLSRGYEAVCLGLTRSGNSHRMDEYIEISHLPAGLGQLLLVALASAGYRGATNGI